MRNLNIYAKNYISHDFENTQVSFRKRNILERIKIHEHRYILEVGCGLDPFYNSFDDFEKLVIVEPSRPFYNNAKTCIIHDNHLKDRVIVINNFLEDAVDEIAQFNFDFIILSCLLPELENVSLFLEKLRGILRKQTVVYVNVPNALSFHRLLALEMGLIQSVYKVSDNNLLFGQNKVYDIFSLSELITRHDYKILNTGSFFIKPFTHKQMFKISEGNIVDERFLDGLYKMSKYMPDLGSEIFMEFQLKD